MITLLVLALLQSGSPPQRVYQPRLFEPGLDGGFDRAFSRGELTPDGRLLVAFRKVEDDQYPSSFRTALTVSVFRPERLLPDANGHHLDGFYEKIGSGVGSSGQNYGQDFAFGKYDEPASASEWAFVHWGNELVPCPTPGAPGCFAPCGALDDGSGQEWMLDPYYPVSDQFGSAQMTLALRPMPAAYLADYGTAGTVTLVQPGGPNPQPVPLPRANPYRSNLGGKYRENGAYLTYKLWLVRTHQLGFDGNKVCNPGNGPLVFPATGAVADPVFVSQNLTVVVNPASWTIVSTSVSEREFIETPTMDGDEKTRGIEPSITEDGRLLVFHGNGDLPGFTSGNAAVTYIFNPTPCSPVGWSSPRSITQLPSDFGPWTEAEFRNRYKIFAQTIRLPDSQLAGGEHTFASPQRVSGTYPWISKDGSFFTAFCLRGTDAPAGENPARQKVGAYACGDLTNGWIKHIDDVGVNPTRLAGGWHWPPYMQGSLRASWTGTTFSTGVKPGLWEPLIGEDPLVPTQVASRRIPILPMFVPLMDTYGEVRFEEADGEYLLYLACNESLVQGLDPLAGVGEAFVVDPDSTPDSSGRDSTARAVLNAGAAFPQELYTTLSGSGDPAVGSANLRAAVGAVVQPTLGPLHESLGFKGQGIAMSTEGRVDVTGAPRLGGLAELTLQMWVKVLPASLPAGQYVLLEYGIQGGGGTKFPLAKIQMDGGLALSAFLWPSSGQVNGPVSASLTGGHDIADPAAGWHHLALVYGPGSAGSELSFFLDGHETASVGLPAGVVVDTPSFTPYYIVGPGRGASAPVVGSDVALVVDEVAVSRVARTEAELRRDAYVELEEPFEELPPALASSLPAGLDPADSRWPKGLAFSQPIADLGRDLFESATLSTDGSVSCATCHDDALAFTDGLTFPTGVGGSTVPGVNTPTVLNAAFGGHKTFSGRAADLEAQVVFPLTSGPEMGGQTMAELVDRVRMDGSLDFEPAYGPGAIATEQNIAEALAMYMRTLNAAGSAFDTTTLAGAARRGQELFFGKARCFGCHRGSNFSDDEFHNVRTLEASSTVVDRGTFTGHENEEGALKTPSLRNVDLTGPWFHDGAETDLLDVLRHYNDPFAEAPAAAGKTDRDLRALELSESDLLDLKAFLQALRSPSLPN